MNKNIKRMFLLTTLILLLIGITATSAVNTNDTNVDDGSSITASVVEKSNDVSIIDDNKDIKTTYKNMKKTPESTVNYYVSDSEGNDENDGSQTSPFKTINTAISKTNSSNIYNIYIGEGTYKGEGNTNLTIPGDNYINIIGAGVNKTVFDGEADFDIQTSGFYWGSSSTWFSYVNGTGNWIMNVTNGTGLITIQNFTVQHAWSNGTRGGSLIGLYPEATIDNWGRLNATNVYFYNNYAGVGAGIRNNPTGLLYVDNCTFENQTKSVSTGNFGSAIYNNGTAYVNNIYVLNNLARWGSVTNDKTLYISNSTFKGGIGYDGTSGQKNGPGIYINTGNADFFAVYESQGLVTSIENCIFEDNQQCDINIGKANITVNNCTFNHSTGIYITSGTGELNVSQIYSNNQFIDIQDSTMFVTMLSTTKPSYAIHSLGNYNITIENNTIDVPNTQYGYGLYVTGNTLVRNNTLNNFIRVNGQNDTIVENFINTTTDSSITLTNSAANCIIANNTLYSASADGDLSISNVLATTTVENNLPTVYTYVVTNDNYTDYFNDDATAKTDVITNGSRIILSGEIINKDFIFDNIKVQVQAESTAKLINATITTRNNAMVSLENLKIDNTDSEGYVILLDSANNKIKNSTINVTTNKALQVIKVEGDSNVIQSTNINATASSGDTVWNADYSIGNVPTAGIFIRSSNNYINNTKIYLNATTKVEGANYPSVDGVDIQSKAVGEMVSNNMLYNTKINVTGMDYVYGLNIARATNTSTSLTYFDVTATVAAYGVQVGDAKNSNIAGYIYAKSGYQADAAYITAMATGKTENTNFSKLYIQNTDAPVVNAIELEGPSGVELSNATYTLNGGKITVIKIAPDWAKNIPENIYINALKITCTATDDDSIFMEFQNTTGVTVTKSNMTSNAGKGINLTNVTNATVKDNFINAGNRIGGNEAVTSNFEATIENNTPSIAVLTDETYSNFFDEKGSLIYDAQIISLGGNLHNKDLKFNKNASINITNVANYTIYNGTVTLEGYSTVYNSTLGTIALNFNHINFNNTDKPVFVDKINGTIQRNVKFANATITVDGDDITAFDAYNNESYIYLDISYSNITMTGNNICVINYSGYNRGQPVYISRNNINVNAENQAVILNTNQATLQFNYNNVTQNAKTAITVNAQNSSISYSNFIDNNIEGSADTIMALNFTKADTYIAYVDGNNINFTSTNPTTAINISGSRTVYVRNNNITINADNNQQPVVIVDAGSSQVTNNYIKTNDVSGDDAVENTPGSISNNTPTQTKVSLENITGIIGGPTTISVDVTSLNGVAITIGSVEFTDENGTVLGQATVSNGAASIDVTYNTDITTQITATYTSGNDLVYGSQNTSTLTTRQAETIITIEPVNATADQTITLTANLADELGNTVTNGKVVFKINGKTVKDANGKIIYAKVVNGTASLEYVVSDDLAGKTLNITASYSGSSNFLAAKNNTTVEVPNKEATLTITPLNESTIGSNITLTATIVDGDKVIDTGKVVFKINGKTVKDANGKIIYAKVTNNTVSVEYTLPESMKAGSYNITAVFTSSSYEKLEATEVLTVIN